MTEKRHIHDVEGLNARLQAITRRAKVDLTAPASSISAPECATTWAH
jgi:hypothetical protein